MAKFETGVFKAPLLVIMFGGAASVDATPEQRARLLEAIKPLKDDSLTPLDAYVAVVNNIQEVMGPDWEPGGEWAAQLDALLAEDGH